MNIAALVVRTDAPPQLVELDTGDISQLTELVGGYFECVELQDGINVWLNEEGKLQGLPWNPNAQVLWDATLGTGTDMIVGTAVLTSGPDANGDALSITDAQLAAIERLLSLVRVRIEDSYEDGHEASRDIWLTAPESTSTEPLEDWWSNIVFEHTGDGHGADHPGLGSSSECTIISGPTELIGQSYSWDG